MRAVLNPLAGIAPNLSEEAQLRDLRTLVEIETPTGNKPQAERCAQAIREIADRLFGLRIRMTSIDTPDGPLLIFGFGSGRPRLALVGHYDTVHEVGTLARHPFSVTTAANGRQIISGPGTYDMKAGIINLLYGLARAAQENPMSRSGEDPLEGVVVYFNPDEETGSRHTSKNLLQLRRAGLTAALVAEGALKGGVLKMGRFGAMWPLVKVQPSSRARPVESVSGDHLTLTVDIAGRRGHPAEVVNNGNALVQAARDIVRCTELPGVSVVELSVPEQKCNRTPDAAHYVLRVPVGQIDAVASLLRPKPDQPLVHRRSASWQTDREAGLGRAAVLRQVATDITRAVDINGPGRLVTPTMVIPHFDGSVSWVPDCRSADETERRLVLTELAKSAVLLNTRRDLPSPDTPDNSQYYEGYNFPPFSPVMSAGLLGILRSIDPTIRGTVISGVSDGSHLAGLGVEVIDGIGSEGAGDHGPDEHVDGGLEERTNLVARAVLPCLHYAQQLAVEQSRTSSTPAFAPVLVAR